jgi:hypothetical protein
MHRGGAIRRPPAPSRRHANAGTVSADSERWGGMLDTVTILQMLLFPDDTVSVPLTTVVGTVKHLGADIAARRGAF